MGSAWVVSVVVVASAVSVVYSVVGSAVSVDVKTTTGSVSVVKIVVGEAVCVVVLIGNWLKHHLLAGGSVFISTRRNQTTTGEIWPS